jgi:hypothetical protein
MNGVIVNTDSAIEDPVLFIGYGVFIAQDHPASPISRYSGEIVLSEEVPAGLLGSRIAR